MKSTLSFFFLAALVFTVSTSWSQESVEDWQKKVVADFPEIGVKGSELNTKYIQKVQSLRSSTPTFFRDPRWPYTIAEQITREPIIPGLEAVTIPAQGTSLVRPQMGNPQMATVPGAGRVELVPAAEAADKGTPGQMICLQGIVAKNFQSTLSDQKFFYVRLQPGVICEFASESFFTRSGRGIPGLGYLGGSAAHKLRFEDGAIFIYGPRGPGSAERNSIMKIGEIFKPGEMVKVYGRYEGSGAVGLDKGILVRDCSLLAPF